MLKALHPICFTLPQISAGLTHTCGVDAFRELTCWGQNVFSQCDVPLLPQQEFWFMVAAGSYHSCGVTTQSRVLCWGMSVGAEVPQSVANETNWLKVAVSTFHSCALSMEGNITCWGDYGDPTNFASMPAGKRWIDVQTGIQFTCGLSSEREVWCWGTTFQGQPPGFHNVESLGLPLWDTIKAGGETICGMRGSFVFCWGATRVGASDMQTYGLASGASSVVLLTLSAGLQAYGSLTFPPAGIDVDDGVRAIIDVVVGERHACFHTVTGSLTCFSNEDASLAALPLRISPEVAQKWTDVEADYGASCGILYNYMTLCWGGIEAIPPSNTGVSWQKISLGRLHICGLSNEGEITCWGEDPNGQVSSGTAYLQDGQHWIDMEAGGLVTCAIRSDQALYCWGTMDYGQLAVPNEGGGTKWQQLAVGELAVCGIMVNGTMRCWGDNTFDQLHVPDVGSMAWTSVSVSHLSCCGVLATGEGRCWGTNENGQANVPSWGEWLYISAGAYHTCGLLTSREITCWGYSGDGSTVVPALKGNDSWIQVSCGFRHTCAISELRGLQCWGHTADGATEPPGLQIARQEAKAAVYPRVHSSFVATSRLGVVINPVPDPAYRLLQWRGREIVIPHNATTLTLSDTEVLALLPGGILWSSNALPGTAANASMITHIAQSPDGYNCALQSTALTLLCWRGGGSSNGTVAVYVYSTPPNVTMVAVGQNGSVICMVHGDSNLYCIGDPAPGLPLPYANSIALSDNSLCLVASNGSVMVISNGSSVVLDPPEDQVFTAVDCSLPAVCGLTDSRSLLCWGLNSSCWNAMPFGAVILDFDVTASGLTFTTADGQLCVDTEMFPGPAPYAAPLQYSVSVLLLPRPMGTRCMTVSDPDIICSPEDLQLLLNSFSPLHLTLFISDDWMVDDAWASVLSTAPLASLYVRGLTRSGSCHEHCIPRVQCSNPQCFRLPNLRELHFDNFELGSSKEDLFTLETNTNVAMRRTTFAGFTTIVGVPELTVVASTFHAPLNASACTNVSILYSTWDSVHALSAPLVVWKAGYFRLSNVIFSSTAGAQGGAVHVDSVQTVAIDSSKFVNCSSQGNGGALYIRGGTTLALHSLQVVNCLARLYGGGIYIESPTSTWSTDNSRFTLTAVDITSCNATNGGGIALVDTLDGPRGHGETKVTLHQARIVNCSATMDGGGTYISGLPKTRLIGVERVKISDDSGLMEVEQLEGVYRGCHAGGKGGAIYLNKVFMLVWLDFTQNTAGWGGGVFLGASDLHIQGSRWSGNEALVNGGDVAAVDCHLSGVSSTGTNYRSSMAGADGGSLYLHRCKLNMKSTKHERTIAGGDGGAVYVINSHSVDILSATFTTITARRNGGAVFFSDISRLVVLLSSFTACHALQGGAMFVANGKGAIQEIDFRNSTASEAAGALHLSGSTMSLLNVACVDSTALGSKRGYGGGCIAVHNASLLTLNSATFQSNSAHYGGDIYLDCTSSVETHPLLLRTSTLSRGVVGSSVYSECKDPSIIGLMFAPAQSAPSQLATGATGAIIADIIPTLYGADVVETPALRLMLVDALNRTVSEDNWTTCSLSVEGMLADESKVELTLLTPNLYTAASGIVNIAPLGVQPSAARGMKLMLTCQSFARYTVEATIALKLPDLVWTHSSSPHFLVSNALSPLYLSPPPELRVEVAGRLLNITGGSCAVSLVTPSGMALHGQLLAEMVNGVASYPRMAVDGPVEVPVALHGECRIGNQLLSSTQHLLALPYHSNLTFLELPSRYWLPSSPGNVYHNAFSLVWSHSHPALQLQGSCVVTLDQGSGVGPDTAVLRALNASASIAEFTTLGIRAPPTSNISMSIQCTSHTGAARKSIAATVAISDWVVQITSWHRMVYRMSATPMEVSVDFPHASLAARAVQESALVCRIEGVNASHSAGLDGLGASVADWQVRDASAVGVAMVRLVGQRGDTIIAVAKCEISGFQQTSAAVAVTIRRTFIRWAGVDVSSLARQWLPSSAILKEPLTPSPAIEVYDADNRQAVMDTREYSCVAQLDQHSIQMGASLLLPSSGTFMYWGSGNSSAITFPTLMIDAPLNFTVTVVFTCTRQGVDHFEPLTLTVHMLKPNAVFRQTPPLQAPTGVVFQAAIGITPAVPAITEFDFIQCGARIVGVSTNAFLDGSVPSVAGGEYNFSSLVLRGVIGQTYELEFVCDVGGKPLPPLRRSVTIPLCDEGFEPDAEARSCRRCAKSYYSPGGMELCLPCPLQGAECTSGALSLLPGFFPANVDLWLSPAARLTDDTMLYPCWTEEACTTTNLSRGSLPCSEGYTGPLCGVCDQGKVRSGNSCVACWPTWASVLTLLLAITVVVAFLAYVAVFQTHKSAVSHGKVILRMVLSYTQMLSALGIFAARATEAFRSAMGITDAIGTSAFQLVPFQCLFPMSFYTSFGLTIALPFIMAPASVAVAACVFAMRAFAPKPTHKPSTTPRKQYFKEQIVTYIKSKSYMGAVLFVLYVLYNSVVYTTSSMLKCRPEVVNGDRMLEADLSVVCYTASHITGIVTAVLVSLLYNLGFPLFILWILRRHRKELHTPRISSRFGFLYQGYSMSRGVYWWEAVVMVRKLAIIMAGSLIDDPWYQIICGISILVVSLVLQVKLAPHDRSLFNRLEAAILSVLCLTQLISLVYLRAETVLHDSEQRLPVTVAVTVILLVLNFGMYLVLLLLAVSLRIKRLGQCLGVGRNIGRQFVSDFVTGRKKPALPRQDSEAAMDGERHPRVPEQPVVAAENELSQADLCAPEDVSYLPEQESMRRKRLSRLLASLRGEPNVGEPPEDTKAPGGGEVPPRSPFHGKAMEHRETSRSWHNSLPGNALPIDTVDLNWKDNPIRRKA